MKRWVAALFLAWSIGLPAHAESPLPGMRFSKESGISIQITNFYEDIPPAGYLPLRVVINNRSPAPHRWMFQSFQSGPGPSALTRFFATLEVKASSDQTFDLLVPLTPQARDPSRYSNIAFTVLGYGVSEGSTSIYSTSGGRTPTAYLGMGKELAPQYWSQLGTRLEKEGSSLEGSTLNARMLPTDWRALAGFDVILFSDNEWRTMAPESRNALREWVAQGGRLILVAPADSTDLPPGESFGAGRIERWPSETNFSKNLEALVRALPLPSATLALKNYEASWPPAAAVGQPTLPYTLLIIFVLVFAAVIGPVNFLVFAPQGNRHRLFWTTPAIALGASALLAILIFARDGVGGQGRYVEAWLSLPDDHRAVRWQEQASRTGALLETSFTPSERTLLLPVNIGGEGSDRGRNYTLDGATWSGDWFRSRSAQAQVLTAVLPSREQVAVTVENGAPAATSSFGRELAEFFYLDEAGNGWIAPALKPGVKTPLKAADKPAFKQWKLKNLGRAGAIVRERFQNFESQTQAPRFFAVARQSTPIKTLAAIRWTEAGAVVFGEVAKP